MSYRLAVLNDLPLAFWALDETSGTTLADVSGQGYNGTQNATSPGLLNQTGLAVEMKGMSFTGLQRFTASIPRIFLNGAETQAFAFECWIKVSAPPTVERGLITRAPNNGLYVTPGGVELRATSDTGELYEAYYTVTDWTRPLHIVANYVGYNLGLIVNGQEGTNADFFGSFSQRGSTVLVGGTATTSATSIIMSAPAIYRNPIDIRTATTHYDYGLASMRPLDIAVAHGGKYYPMDDTSASVAYSYVEDTRADFDRGINENLVITDDYILAPGVDGTHTSDIQYVGDLVNVVGSRISWQGSSSIIVETSLDMGVTWSPCTNYATVPGIGPYANLANKFLMVRKRFVGVAGLDYFPLLDNVSVVIYTAFSRYDTGSDGVAIHGSLLVPPIAESPAKGLDNMGITFTTASYGVLPATVGGTRAISLWYKRDAAPSGTAAEYILDNRNVFGSGARLYFNSGIIASAGFSVIYVNGVSKTPTAADFPVGQWVHILGVLSTLSSSDIFLNSSYAHDSHGRASFAHPTLFARTKNARDASTLYGMYRGSVNKKVKDTNTVSVSETSDGPKAYSYAWYSTRNSGF